MNNVIDVFVIKHKGKLIGLDLKDADRLMKRQDKILNTLLGILLSGLLIILALLASR